MREAPEGGYTARAIGYSIFTEGSNWEHLKYMMRAPCCATLTKAKRLGQSA